MGECFAVLQCSDGGNGEPWKATEKYAKFIKVLLLKKNEKISFHSAYAAPMLQGDAATAP